MADKKSDYKMSVYVTREIAERVRREAFEAKISQGEIVTQALQQYWANCAAAEK